MVDASKDDRAESDGVGRRFMRWRGTLAWPQRWLLDACVFGICVLIICLEIADILRWIGAL